MEHDGLVIVMAGTQRYAIDRRHVAALKRRSADAQGVALATLLGMPAGDDEAYMLAMPAVVGAVFRIDHADLRERLPQLALPGWLQQQAHPAIDGVVLDGAELIPLIDLARLALQIGYVDS